MDTRRVGSMLLALSMRVKFAEIQELLESLTDEDQRREVVRYRDQVSES